MVKVIADIVKEGSFRSFNQVLVWSVRQLEFQICDIRVLDLFSTALLRSFFLFFFSFPFNIHSMFNMSNAKQKRNF